MKWKEILICYSIQDITNSCNDPSLYYVIADSVLSWLTSLKGTRIMVSADNSSHTSWSLGARCRGKRFPVDNADSDAYLSTQLGPQNMQTNRIKGGTRNYHVS